MQTAHISSYVAVRVVDLGKYLDHKVRLRVVGGLVREGKLVDIDKGVAVVVRRYTGALVTVRVPLVQVTTAEVYL